MPRGSAPPHYHSGATSNTAGLSQADLVSPGLIWHNNRLNIRFYKILQDFLFDTTIVYITIS